MKLSTESGRFSDYVNGKSFAIIGGRGTPSPDDIARGTLLFEAAVLTRFSKQSSPKPPYSSSVPPPPNWVGVNGAQQDGGGWAEQNFSVSPMNVMVPNPLTKRRHAEFCKRVPGNSDASACTARGSKTTDQEDSTEGEVEKGSRDGPGGLQEEGKTWTVVGA